MPADENQRTILIVDDDRGLLRLMERALQREGFCAVSASSGKEALDWLATHKAELLLLDLKLQDIPGQDLVRKIAKTHVLPFVIITGQGDERVAVEIMKRGARDYLVKDADFLQFLPEVVRHVMEQLETERRLAAAEDRVRLVESVVERGFSAVLIADARDLDPRVLYINPSFAQLTGYSPEEVAGQPLSALSGLSAIHQRLQQGIREGERVLEEVCRFATPDGERWGDWRVGPVKDRNGRITHWLVILRDITERKRLEKDILEISDREQRRIGQDLHDGLCQQLAGIELMSQALEQKIAGRSRSDAARAGEIAGHVREAIRQTRLLARGLSPVTLESEGLMSALQELASNTEKIFHVHCHFVCDPPVLVRDQATATHLFRIAQEAVSNGLKHGKASRISIQLTRKRGRIRLLVADNGAGFPEPLPGNGGMGLRIMRSRAGMIGGTLVTDNSPAGGAQVSCEIAVGPNRKHNGRARKKDKDQTSETDSYR